MSTEKEDVKIIYKILNIIGLIACFLCMLFGFLYAFQTNSIIAVFASLVLLVAFWSLTQVLIHQKSRTDNNRSVKNEYVLIGIYFIIILVSFPFCNHFISVDLYKREEIKNAALNKLTVCDDLIKQYSSNVAHKKDSLGTVIENAARNFINSRTTANQNKLNKFVASGSYGPRDSGPNIMDAIKPSIESKKKDLEIRFSIDDAQGKYDKFSTEALSVFNNWNRLKLSSYYYRIDSQYNNLIAITTHQMNDFTFTEDYNQKLNFYNVLDSFKSTPFYILLFVLVTLVAIHLCILSVYFAVKRKESLDENVIKVPKKDWGLAINKK